MGFHSLLQGIFPEIQLRSPALQADSLPSEPPGKPRAFKSIVRVRGSSTRIWPEQNQRLGKGEFVLSAALPFSWDSGLLLPLDLDCNYAWALLGLQLADLGAQPLLPQEPVPCNKSDTSVSLQNPDSYYK